MTEQMELLLSFVLAFVAQMASLSLIIFGAVVAVVLSIPSLRSIATRWIERRLLDSPSSSDLPSRQIED